MRDGPVAARGPRRRGVGTRGETLIELLATVTVMGIAVIAVVFGMAVAVKASGTDRKYVRLEILLRNGAEAISAADYAQVTGDYSPVVQRALATIESRPGETFTITSALNGCLDVNGSATGCTPDPGVQELTLTASLGQSSKTLVIVKRNAGVGSP